MAKKAEDRPLYQQVKESILQRIEQEKLNPGDALPTESELELMYQVSRTTVRQAIGELQNEGYITKQQGRGTFVANNSYEDCQAVLQSFTKDVAKKGISVKTNLISRDLIIPEEALIEETDCGTEPLLRIQRIRYIEGVPSILTTSYLPKLVYSKLDWKNIDFKNVSLYATIEEAGFDFESGEETVSLKPAPLYEASLLQIDEGYPISINRRKVYDKQGRLIEFSRSVTRGDRYQLYIKLKKKI